MMRLWVALGVLLFSARCAEQLRPMVRTYWNAFGSEAAAPEEPPSRPPVADPRGPRARPSPSSLRLASWNLHWLNTPGRGPEQRGRSDYAALRAQAERLDADIIAVQEVASEAALRWVFPEERYAVHLAARGGSQKTGFVYRRALHVTPHEDVESLAQETLRAGADLSVRTFGQDLRLLAVHLKAYCVQGSLARPTDDCRKLRSQVPGLEAWVDARAREGVAFAVVGDFNRVLSDDRDELFRELNDGEPEGLVLTRASLRTRTMCGAKRQRAVLDHVVLGGAAARWLVPDSFVELSYVLGDDDTANLSDHCPIAADLRVESLR